MVEIRENVVLRFLFTECTLERRNAAFSLMKETWQLHESI